MYGNKSKKEIVEEYRTFLYKSEENHIASNKRYIKNEIPEEHFNKWGYPDSKIIINGIAYCFAGYSAEIKSATYEKIEQFPRLKSPRVHGNITTWEDFNKLPREVIAVHCFLAGLRIRNIKTIEEEE
jgi:hypothetical protein